MNTPNASTINTPEQLKEFGKFIKTKEKELEKENIKAFKEQGLRTMLREAYVELQAKRTGALEYIQDAKIRGIFSKTVAEKEIKTILDDMYNNKSDVEIAIFSFQNGNSFPYENRFNAKTEINIGNLKESHSIIYHLLNNAYNRLKPLALEIRQLKKDYEKRREVVTQKTAIQRSLDKLKTNENEKMLKDYFESLSDWERAELIENEIFVNGKNIGKEARVGVKIGSGTRLHIMDISIIEVEDKETKEKTKVIGAFNGTRWQQSDLIIIDTIDSIPSELISLIK